MPHPAKKALCSGTCLCWNTELKLPSLQFNLESVTYQVNGPIVFLQSKTINFKSNRLLIRHFNKKY